MPIRTRRRDASTSRACCSLRADQRFPTAPASLAPDLVGAARRLILDLAAHRTRSRRRGDVLDSVLAMGEIVEFASNGGTAQGYLATPRSRRPAPA